MDRNVVPETSHQEYLRVEIKSYAIHGSLFRYIHFVANNPPNIYIYIYIYILLISLLLYPTKISYTFCLKEIYLD